MQHFHTDIRLYVDNGKGLEFAAMLTFVNDSGIPVSAEFAQGYMTSAFLDNPAISLFDKWEIAVDTDLNIYHQNFEKGGIPRILIKV